MDSLAIACQPFFEWLMRTTLQVSLLICVILLIQKALGHRLGVRGRYCLWLVLLIRMAMPWAPQSRVSVYNLLPPSLTKEHSSPAVTAPGRHGLASAVAGRISITASKDSADDASATMLAGRLESQEGLGPVDWMMRGMSLCWLVGVCCLTGYTIAGSLRLWRIVRPGRRVTDQKTLDLLEDCQRLIGTQTTVRMVATDRIGSPALLGFLRPKLLLPRETLAQANLTELRHIFLHELAHLKRHDVLIGYAASVLHVLHWFNPLVALAFRRMRADRELACDALALSSLAPEEAPAYGRTVIGQIERLLASGYRPTLIGLCGVRAQTRQRVALIAGFRKGTYRWSPLAIALLALVACAGLTDRHAVRPTPSEAAEPAVADWDEYARRDFPTTHQDKHANIQRACIRSRQTGKYLVVHGETVTCDADEPGAAGLWEFRFDEVSNSPESTVYFYSVATQKYLMSDKQGNLMLGTAGPTKAARWAAYPWPEGVRIISYEFKHGHLRVDEEGHVRTDHYARDAWGHWDIHVVWRIKTSDDPESNPQWQREKIPGPD